MLINIWFNRKDVKTLNRPSHPTQSTYESNCPFHFCERIHTAIKMASAEHVLTLRSSKTWISLFLHQIWRNVAFHQLLTNGSSAVNGCQRHRFCLLKILTDGLEWCGLLVDYCDVFISCLDSHSDGTHSLQRIHCWASDGMLHFSKSVK